MSFGDARQLALDVLIRVDGGAASDRALDRWLRRSNLPAREKGLATTLTYGVLRRRSSLDKRIAEHSSRALDGIDAMALNALRLGVYQIDHLDRVPDHAAVNATVDAVKRLNRGAAGFVNAVLRSLLRARAKGASSRDDADAVPSPSRFEDVPAWWAKRWRERFGDVAALRWFDAALEPSPMVIRPHPRVRMPADLIEALRVDGVEVVPAMHAPGAFRVVAGNPVGSTTLRDHAFALRGEASQLVPSLLPVGRAGRVLDACAGRGGKAIQIAEDSAASAVVANDVSEWRAVACRREAAVVGASEVRAVVSDLAVPAPFEVAFTAALVDAPCSGLGTVRRRPELKWRVDPSVLGRLATLQKSILGHAIDSVVAGGFVLYATCSTEPEENEEVIGAVLAQRDDVELRPVQLPAGVDERFVAGDGFFRTYPLFADLDGFFAALLAKTR